MLTDDYSPDQYYVREEGAFNSDNVLRSIQRALTAHFARSE